MKAAMQGLWVMFDVMKTEHWAMKIYDSNALSDHAENKFLLLKI